MANTKISQLPTWTGSANDLRWFVMNNSGNNETYKFSGYTSPFIVDAGNSIFSTFGTPAVYDADCVGSVIIGSEAAGYDDYTTLVGWKAIGNNDIEGRCSAFGADSQATSRFATALGMSTRAAGSFSTAVGHNASSGGGNSTAIGATSNASGPNSLAIGYGVSCVGANSSAIGGQSNSLTQSNSVILNGISSTISGVGSMSGIFSSQNATINSDGTYNIIIGGFGNTISGSSSAFSSIIGSYNSTLVDRNNSVMLGTSGRTGTSDYTTYVENIHSFRTPSTQVQPVSSGTTFTCNLNNGGKSQFYITGTNTINITNVRDGQSFMIKTQTNGNYVTTWTATGYTFVFQGGIKDPGNNVTDIFVFEVFGSVIYGNRRHNYS